jgi:hypothetical protein
MNHIPFICVHVYLLFLQVSAVFLYIAANLITNGTNETNNKLEFVPLVPDRVFDPFVQFVIKQ